MSEELELKLKEAQEKIRLNAIEFLTDLGYKGKTDELTIDQIDARIEILKEQKEEEKKNKKAKKPKIQGIDGFKENIKAATGQDPIDPEEGALDNYDALEALISQLAPDERLNRFQGSRIMRVWKPIDLGNGRTTLRRLMP